MSSRDDGPDGPGTDGEPGDSMAAHAAPPSASRSDSGREAQPRSAETVQDDARIVDRIERQNAQAEDGTGINPDRRQGSGGPPDDPAERARQDETDPAHDG